MLMDILWYIKYAVEDTIGRLKKNYRNNRKKNKYYFQKCVAIAAVSIWIIAGIKSYNDRVGIEETTQIVNVFGANAFNRISSEISCCAKYVDWAVSDNTKIIILENIAKEIGINKYQITDNVDGENKEKILTQNSVNGNVCCKYITTKDNISYISMNIVLYDTIDSTFSYQRLMEDILKDLGINTNVSVNLIGEIKGNMNIESRNRIADYLLESIDAKVVCENREEDLYTIYAYNKNIKQYINAIAGKVNVNLTINYDSDSDVSFVNLAMPINNKDY